MLRKRYASFQIIDFWHFRANIWWYLASRPLKRWTLLHPLLHHLLQNRCGRYLFLEREQIVVGCRQGFRTKMPHTSLSRLKAFIASSFHITFMKHHAFTSWYSLTTQEFRLVLLGSKRHLFSTQTSRLRGWVFQENFGTVMALIHSPALALSLAEIIPPLRELDYQN